MYSLEYELVKLFICLAWLPIDKPLIWLQVLVNSFWIIPKFYAIQTRPFDESD